MKNLGIYRTVLLVGFFLSTSMVFAQSGEGRQKLEAAKIGLITERLGLTPDQAEKFWPIYKEYSAKRREIQADFMEIRKNYDKSTATEESTRKMLKRGREIKQQKLNLEQEYSERMLGVIDSRQLVSLQEAEGDFRNMLLRKLEQRQNRQQNREQIRDKNQQRLNQRRN